ncbi:MAG: helix-hairpin-helix domain-containing protein [Deltaproteobacteria bacterium]|nr:helix-hairpin-helix domain-containing protein [Deltaproteobacteria bacterium]
MAQHFNLNTIGVDELSNLPMVGRRRAELIIKYRNEHGPFRSWDDLNNIPGFSQGMVNDLREGGASLDSEEQRPRGKKSA